MQTVTEYTRRFNDAVREGDRGGALQCGKRVLSTATRRIDELRELHAQRSLQGRLGFDVPDTHEIQHYEAICAQMSAALQRNGFESLELSCEPEPFVPNHVMPTCAPRGGAQCAPPEFGERRRVHSPVPVRATERLQVQKLHDLHHIERQLEHTSTLLSVVHRIVDRAQPAIDQLQGNMDAVPPRLDRTRDQLLRAYAPHRRRSWCAAMCTHDLRYACISLSCLGAMLCMLVFS